MLSRTKTLLDDDTIKKIFMAHGIDKIRDIKPLGAGEFNAVYLVRSDKDYVLKVAPDEAYVLTHEQKMLESEVHWYHVMHEQTDIPCPKIYFEDFSKEIIPQNYFVMEHIDGIQKDELKVSEEVKRELNRQITEMIAKLHKITNDKFGYEQNGLYDNWYDAYRHIIMNLIADGEKAGQKTEQGGRLLALTENYKDALLTARCHLVNADGWDPNFIAVPKGEGYQLYWIDPERNLWGDKVMDLMCVEFEHTLKDKEIITYYNKISNDPVGPTREEEIRYAFSLGWVALVMEVEKYYRYSPDYEGWHRNIEFSNFMYQRCFDILNQE